MSVEQEILALEDKRCAARIEVDVNGQRKSLRPRYLNAWTRTARGRKFVAWQSTARPAA